MTVKKTLRPAFAASGNAHRQEFKNVRKNDREPLLSEINRLIADALARVDAQKLAEVISCVAGGSVVHDPGFSKAECLHLNVAALGILQVVGRGNSVEAARAHVHLAQSTEGAEADYHYESAIEIYRRELPGQTELVECLCWYAEHLFASCRKSEGFAIACEAIGYEDHDVFLHDVLDLWAEWSDDVGAKWLVKEYDRVFDEIWMQSQSGATPSLECEKKTRVLQRNTLKSAAILAKKALAEIKAANSK